MKIAVKVKPGAKTEKVVKISDGQYEASVKALARDGNANKALIALLSNYFKVPKIRVVLTGGEGSRHKRVEFLE